MDILILVGSFAIVCLMGMPVAYALGLAAILGALWTGIPLEAVMLKVSGGMSGFSLLAIPFFILCGAIMAVGGMAERLVNVRQSVRWLHSRRHGTGQHRGLDDVRLHLGLVGRRHRRGRRGDDPADDQERLSAAVRGQCHDLRLAAAPAAAAVAQHGDLLARRRRHYFGRTPFHGRRDPGAAAGPVANRAGPHHRASAKLSKGRGRPAPAGTQDRARRGLGPGHHRDHPRRHPHRGVHADRNPPPSPASTPSWSPCSSIATASGAICRN